MKGSPPERVAQHADSWTPPLPVQTISPSGLLYFVSNTVIPQHTQAYFLPLPLLFQRLISGQSWRHFLCSQQGPGVNPYTAFTSYLYSTPLSETLSKSFQRHGCHQPSDPDTHHSKTVKGSRGTHTLPWSCAISFPPPLSPHPPFDSSIMSQNNLLLSLLQTSWCICALEFCSCNSHPNALPSPLWILQSHHPSKHTSAMMPFLAASPMLTPSAVYALAP